MLGSHGKQAPGQHHTLLHKHMCHYATCPMQLACNSSTALDACCQKHPDHRNGTAAILYSTWHCHYANPYPSWFLGLRGAPQAKPAGTAVHICCSILLLKLHAALFELGYDMLALALLVIALAQASLDEARFTFALLHQRRNRQEQGYLHALIQAVSLCAIDQLKLAISAVCERRSH
jgi:hypothetical protein